MRSRININRDWRFKRADVQEACDPGMDDSSWQNVGLPHTFDLPYFRTPEFYVGTGWYRKRLVIPDSLAGRKLFLEFEGAFQVADVFVNGQRAGGHEGGYTPFIVDITPFAIVGENLIAIRVNNDWNPRLAPRAGEHIFSGGLYRDVHLLATAPLHIAWNSHWITTPVVSHQSATVRVRAEVTNDSKETRDCLVVSRVIDPGGACVAEIKSRKAIAGGERAELDMQSPSIANPRLWHPDHPHLYRVETSIHSQGTLCDVEQSSFGFRWFAWTADRGFFLNDQHLYLRGANAHQDHAGWGIGITQSAIWRDVRLLKECGMNFVRGAHYPHHRAMAEACDELGLIFWSENCFWGKGGFGPEGYWNASAYPTLADDVEPFSRSCKQTLEEMIRSHRNHPSIVVWSMTNEAFFTFNLDHARALMSDLVQHCRRLDPNRLAAIGGAQRGKIDHLGDVAGYNGDGAQLFINPGVANMVSEYGAISKPVDACEPFWGELQTEYFPWRGGQAIWCGFDYGSIAGKQGLKGIVRHDRLPKRSWFWYRNAYRQIALPAFACEGNAHSLKLSTDKSTINGTDATDDCQIVVSVHDEQGRLVNVNPAVTLTIESGPGEFATGASITFDPSTDIQIADGQAAAALRSYAGGVTRIIATADGLVPAEIQITTIGEPPHDPAARAASRPYVPPTPSEASIRAMKNAVNVARDRPSKASSALPDHPARFANDADKTTHWQAASNSVGEWVMIDLEGFYQLSDCRLTFAQAGNFRYVVDTSVDREHWKREIDRSQSVRTDPARHDVFDAGTVARYVRLTIVNVPENQSANLAEIEIHGVLSLR